MEIFKQHKLIYGLPHISFDIETTKGKYGSYMYVAMFGLSDGSVIWCRDWIHVKITLVNLESRFRKEMQEQNIDKLIIWVHNLSYEFAFMRKEFNFTKVFAKSKREILSCDYGIFQFRDSYSISGTNLENTCKLYNLSVNKKSGALDYSKQRNSLTPLTDFEKEYCECDVLSLVEFSKKMAELYVIPQGYLPFTKTGILRHEVKELAKDKKYYNIKKQIKATFPDSLDKYHYYMNYLFSGGITHTNLRHVGLLLKDVYGIDIKSDYPWQIASRKFPYGKPITIENPTLEKCLKLKKDGFHVIMAIEVNDIKLRKDVPFSFISKHKLVSSKSLIEDNGKIYEAKQIKLMVTELDLECLMEVYNYSEPIEIKFAEYYTSDFLPEYIVKPILDGFIEKEKLGKEHPFYLLSKQKPNSGYGMMVTRFVENDLMISDGNIVTNPDYKFSYNKEKFKAILSPIQGLYVTSWARYTLIKMANKIGEYDCCYCDTDSLYIRNFEKYEQLFNDYNEKVYAYNKKLGLPKPCLKLGTFENEGRCSKAKFLGAKRYIYRRNGEVKTTVSGMKKGTLKKLAETQHKSQFELFNDGLILSEIFANKLTHKYIDDEVSEEITDEFGNTELMSSKSCINLNDTTFSLTLPKAYKLVIEHFNQETKYEKRL